MLLKRNTLSQMIRYTLAAGLATGLGAGVASAQEEENAELDKVQVTGSRIKRTDVEGALPVTVIDREAIEMSGETTVADFLRNTTFNSAGSYRPQSGSSWQGVSVVNLRGLGSARTLVLVDGRRLPKSPITGSNQDLTSIPMGAVERIEILTDGASAIYGSDAMAGVINIITRQDYQGAEVTIGQAQVSIPAEGGDREEGSIVFGAASNTSSLMGGVSWNNRDIIFARDFPWNGGGASVFSNSYTTFDENGYDQFNWVAFPGACDFPGTGYFILGARCAYDFTMVSADEASTGAKALWLKAKHEVNDNWTVWANAQASKTSSFGRYAPVPDSSYYYGVPLSVDSPNNPGNPNGYVYDPNFDPQPVNWWHRFDALGNRDSTVENEMLDATFGATGYIGTAEVDFGIRRTSNTTADIGRNFLLGSQALAHIESGAYNLADPYNVDPAILNSMKVTISRIAEYHQNEIFGSASFDLFDMDAGTVQLAVGAEYREEMYNDQYDSLSEAGVVGGSAGNSAGGNRDVTAMFFETLIPVMDNLEVSVAGRYDDYSDYGSDFTPKVSARFQPMDTLTLRASYGKGFRAPNLDIVTALDAFSATSVRDPQSCINQGQPEGCSLQINNIITANPSLASEASDQFALGVAMEPADWVNFAVDYYNIEISDRIRSISAQNIINLQAAGDPIPAGLSITRSTNGSIIEIVSGFANEGDLDLRGFDVNVKTNFDLFGGTLMNNLQISKLTHYSLDGGRDLVGDPGLPDNRITLNNMFNFGDFSFVWNVNAIADTADTVSGGEREGKVPSWVTNDLQINYNAPWNGRFTIGAMNIGEKYPPIGLGNVGVRDYDFNLYNGYGRVTYARYTQTF